MQHAYWIGRRDDQELGGVGCHAYLELTGPARDPERLEAAVHALLARHPMLRARFHADGTQQVQDTSPWPGLTVHDLRELAGPVAGLRLAATRDLLGHRRLDVGRGEVVDVQLTLLPDASSVLHLNIDLLVADVQSIRVLLHDLALLYAGRGDALPALTTTFPDYLAARGRETDREADRAYWLDRLADLPGAPELPLAPRDRATRTRFRRRVHRLSAVDWRRFQAAARGHGLTAAMALATAYAEALGRWSARPEFLLNLPLFDRQPLHEDVPHLVADFTSLVLLPVDTAGAVPFAQRARVVQASLREHLAHTGFSGVEVLRELARTGRAAPVVFACNLGERLVPDTARAELGEWTWMLSQTPQVWLDHQVYEQDGELLLAWDSVDALFPDGLVEDLFAAYTRLVDGLAAEGADWTAPAVPPLPAGQEVLRAAVNAGHRVESGNLLHTGFFDWADRAPERTALRGAGDALTYGQAADRALRVARWLLDRDVRPGEAVAVSLPKGVDQVVAVLGVLAAGAVYVPVGPDQPPRRRERVLSRAGVRVTLDPAAFGAAVTGEPLGTPVDRRPEDSAYVIFTSGSTGEPKGVEITHRAAVNTVEEVNDRFGVTSRDRVLAVCALDFDLSVYDLFGLLGAGGEVVLCAEHQRRDPAALAELVHGHGITLWNSVPALLDQVLAAAPGRLGSLRLALVSGDWVGLDLGPRFTAATGGRLVALGGATEAAIWSNALEVEEVPAEWTSVPYGFPLRNQRYRVADDQGRDRPDWVPGELWIGGTGVALGYRGDPERTRERFVEHGGQRWYRTGDLGRYWADGTLEFLGRTDHQVKLRGHRVELGEVEHHLARCPGVRRAVAVVDRDRLLAAVTAESEVDTAALRAALAECLPAYMLPAVLRQVPELPLTANGKLDRAAVTALLADAVATPAPAPPRGELETRLAAVWAEVLGVPEVGRESDFFLLGGDSLQATRLIARLTAEGVHGAGLDGLFATPVLAEFASTVRLGPAPGSASALRADPAHRFEPFPLTEVQRAYLLGRDPGFVLGGVAAHSYFEFEGVHVDLPRLEAAWRRLVEHHDMLRVVLDPDGGQRVLARVPELTIEVTEAGERPEADLAALRERLSHRVADLTAWPLFAVAAVRYGDRLRLAVSLDNLALDGLSCFRLIAESFRLYTDPAAPLSTTDIGFRDYVLALPPARESSVDYWRARLDTLPPAPALPLRVDPAEVGRPRFTRRTHRVPAATWDRVKEHARTHRATPSAVLLACYAEVLAAWSEHPALTVTLTLFDHRDPHPGLPEMLGDFTSLALFAHESRPERPWSATLRRVQRRLAQDLEHRDVSAEWVRRELTQRLGSPAAAAMPVIFTSALGLTPPAGHEAAGFEEVWGLSQTPQAWLDHQVYESGGDLVLNWDAVEELFPEGLLDALATAGLDLVHHLAREAAHWERPLPDPLPAAQRAVRDRVNATAAPVGNHLLHEGFLAQDPARTALLWDGGALTYGQLSERAARIAGHLQARGVRAGDAVAVTLPKGPDQVAAVLGVLLAGGVYVPVGVDQPKSRQDSMFTTAGVRHILDEQSTVEAQRAERITTPVVVGPDDLAYVIFTSGSTGEPKGVELTHRAAHNTVTDITARFGLTAGDRGLAVSSVDFDLSVFDLFGILGTGGALVLPTEDERRDPRRWRELLRAHRVTVWNTVPALLDLLLTAAGPPPASLRLALLSGDWVGLDLPARLHTAAPDCRLVALGGATEAAIWSNALEVHEVPAHWTSVPYGFPLRNQSYRVADDHGRDRPDWVPGELWIGGTGLARGYRGDPGTTDAKFTTRHGQRWYRTGDRGRYWPDGTLEFLGRTDHQVKIRGHRLELGEVETALHAHPLVRQAVVLAVGDRGHRRLHAFCTGEIPDRAGLVAFLGERLPAYAIPPAIDVLPELPLTGNGKVDRAALAHLAEQARTQDGEAPEGELEIRLAALWARLLGLPRLGRHENFFALGGDSVLAMKLITLLDRELGLDLTLRQLVATPTVAELAGAAPTCEEGAL
ncbi:amino acid adenylation domain-containing protein [Crossiella equi]|uniref:Phenyloxazoline synthase MbtB n=1 Tax=Crossiella equi TaxID=130796 RepID=A0ABS5AAN8_9PSEU|nr:amino acid adenylation domain-containing protein [Crossiella equi]